MRYRVTHSTTYRYAADVARCYNQAHLLLRSTARQQCLSSRLSVRPKPETQGEYIDYFGNRVSRFAIDERHRELEITAVSDVLMREQNLSAPLAFGMTADEVRARLRTAADPATLAAREYMLPSPMIRRREELAAYARELFAGEAPFVPAVRRFTGKIHEEFTYEPGFTTVSTPLREVLAHRRGVCQDFAQLAIGCLRSLGFAAKYVSGYIETLPPPGQEKLVGADATHAWFAVYVPGEGWAEFDPTNDQPAGTQHVVTAEGRDYADVTPVSGVIFGGGESHQLEVGVTVARLDGGAAVPAP